MNSKDCTVLVCSCDSYDDTWAPFFKFFHMYWPDCDYPVVLNTESKCYRSDEMDVICYQFYDNNRQIPYGERLLEYLKKIDTPYILILMDDFFIRKKVDAEKIEFCLNELQKHEDIAVFSFDSVKDEMNIDDGVYEDFLLRPRCGEYKVNFQGGGVA